jgi:phosphotransacetylase
MDTLTRLPEARWPFGDALLARCRALAPVRTAVVHPCDETSVQAACEAASLGLIAPILVGPDRKILAAAERAGVDVSGFPLISTPHSHAAADRGVALVRAGEASMIMKGSLHTDELMHAVLTPDSGLRTGRRVSHVYLMEAASYPKPLLITDGAINISPSLDDKRDIAQNAIDLARIIGIAEPKLAILSAVETVSARIPSTTDAASLCKMADRGQITGGILDGPLAFDNAISPAAAAEKGIVSPVAGNADILLAPDLVAGNILAKQLTFLGGAHAAGVVLGARVPIILTSRADSEQARVVSCALGVLVAECQGLVTAQPVAAHG